MAIPNIADPQKQAARRRYRQEYARLKARLREVGFICTGSLVERWMPCGKPNCACAQNPHRQHGPYFQLSWKEKGKTVSRRLSAEHATLYRQWITNRQCLEKIVQQMQRVSRQAQRQLLRPQKARKRITKSGDIASIG